MNSISVMVAVSVAVFCACRPAAVTEPTVPSDAASAPAGPVLADHLLVTWYGNPRTARMGVLGRHRSPELAKGLRAQAGAYAHLTRKKIVPAYHLVAVIAQPHAGRDKMWRRRETHDTIRSMLAQARANQFKLILDVQPGRSTVRAEMDYLRPYLEEPDVYLALDPEFAMKDGETPGRKIGHMAASEINDAIGFLDAITRERKLPPKVLIVHQFTMNMVGDPRAVRDSPLVDVVLDVDGFGGPALKRAMYTAVIGRRALEYPGIKLFYKEDTNLMTEADVMKLQPEPAVIIYQ